MLADVFECLETEAEPQIILVSAHWLCVAILLYHLAGQLQTLLTLHFLFVQSLKISLR